jgi:uncharacterized protein YciI
MLERYEHHTFTLLIERCRVPRMDSVSRWTWAAAFGEGRCGGTLGRLALAALVMACGSAQHPENQRVTPASLLQQQPGYLVVYRPAERWQPDQTLPKEPLDEHARYLLSLYRAGTLKIAGRFGNGKGGAMLITAPDEATALALVNADPAVVSDVYDFDMRPWLLADWAERDLTWPK